MVPSAVLVALGIRTIRQEEELREKRQHEEKLRVAGLVRQELIRRLDALALRAAGGQISPGDPDVALVARLDSGRLAMPWEIPAPQQEPDRGFDAALRQAQRQLHQLRDPEGASAQARAAALKARTPAERARADLLLAACLRMKGAGREAHGVLHRLLAAKPPATDEYGVPYLLYAAQQLVDGAPAEEQRQILDAVSETSRAALLSPTAAHMAADLLGRLRPGTLHELAAARAGELDQLAGLPSEVALLEKAVDQTWSLYGNGGWLVGLTGKSGDPHRLLIAVRARRALDAIRLPGGVRWVLGGAEGDALGERFPGLRLAGMPYTGTDRAGSRQLFYLSALLLVLSVTAFSAWLLNRDVQRERRLAALRSQFVSSVSHELRTPISTIRTCAELLDMGRVRDERQASEYLKTIAGESARLSRLVAGVLDFSRMEQGERTYHFRPVSLEEALESAARELEYLLAQGGFQLRIAVDAAVSLVRADPEAIEQAVVNLLVNAMKYSGERREIELSLNRDGDHAVIRVRDYGIGIAPEEQARIFDRFHRAPLADGRVVPGTGLGLTIVAQIVKAHRGRVTVESQPGNGSTFSIFLPAGEDS